MQKYNPWPVLTKRLPLPNLLGLHILWRHWINPYLLNTFSKMIQTWERGVDYRLRCLLSEPGNVDQPPCRIILLCWKYYKTRLLQRPLSWFSRGLVFQMMWIYCKKYCITKLPSNFRAKLYLFSKDRATCLFEVFVQDREVQYLTFVNSAGWESLKHS
jgi:hypothetical protein